VIPLRPEATKESADTQKQAMLDIERPQLLFENLKLFGFYSDARKESDPPLSFEEIKRRAEAPKYPCVTYRLKNYGKSPAWIKRWAISFKAFPQLPLVPIYEAQPVIGYAIPSGEDSPGECPFRPIGMTYAQWMQVLAGQLHLFVYGFVEYGDIFKATIPHKAGYCWKWIVPNTLAPGGYWEPSGPDSYWYYD
jgi:hypothetical protein